MKPLRQALGIGGAIMAVVSSFVLCWGAGDLLTTVSV